MTVITITIVFPRLRFPLATLMPLWPLPTNYGILDYGKRVLSLMFYFSCERGDSRVGRFYFFKGKVFFFFGGVIQAVFFLPTARLYHCGMNILDI